MEHALSEHTESQALPGKTDDLLLTVRGLKTWFFQEEYTTRAINGISFDVPRGKTVCLVGESGCGKSLTAYSILGMVPWPGRVTEGEILFDGENMLAKTPRQLQNIRGSRIGMIFQEPMTSLNPVLRIGFQIEEVYRRHQKLDRRQARERALQMLRLVQIPEPEKRYHEYPHQLSGGMRQRVMIAMALACRPQLLICDEPTTALDVTVQAQILKLISDLQNELNMSVLLITHDLGVVSEMADDVVVVYAGEVVEKGRNESIFRHPLHPYTRALLSSIPRINSSGGSTQPMQKLYSIRGSVPVLHEEIPGCAFAPRCDYATDICRKNHPVPSSAEDGHTVACHHAGSIPPFSESNDGRQQT